MIGMEAQFIAIEALLLEGQGTVVHERNNSSDSDSSLDKSEDGDDGAGERGARLCTVCNVAPLNMDSGTGQWCLEYFGAVKVSCSGVIISVATLQCYRISRITFCVSGV
jgi:hypothetical protein